MPKFWVTVSRVEEVAFDLEVIVEADNPQAAIDHARKVEERNGWESHWEEVWEANEDAEYRALDHLYTEYAANPAPEPMPTCVPDAEEKVEHAPIVVPPGYVEDVRARLIAGHAEARDKINGRRQGDPMVEAVCDYHIAQLDDGLAKALADLEERFRGKS